MNTTTNVEKYKGFTETMLEKCLPL